MASDTLKLEFPLIYCPDCTSQLGCSGVYVASDDETLVCAFCARDRIAQGDQCRPIFGAGPRPKRGGLGLAGEGAQLEDREAVALLLRHGATVHGRYEDRATGDVATPAQVLAELGLSVGGHDLATEG